MVLRECLFGRQRLAQFNEIIAPRHRHRGGNLLANRFAGGAQGIIAQMGVALSRGAMRVAQQRTNDRQAGATRNRDAGKAMPEIVKPDIL